MSELVYSQEAESILNLFYQADYMVYVEGEDDICFWEVVLNKTSSLKFEIQDVGGCDLLLPYIEKVKNEESNCIVACDSDLIKFRPEYQDVKGVIRTYGYSIENSFVTPKTVLRVIKLLGKINAREMPNVDYEQWLNNFNQKFFRLICLDIYNFLNNKGVSVVGDNASRFMISKNSYEICELKIEDFIQSLPQDFIELDPNTISSLIQPEKPSIDFWIRGHFLFSAAQRYISGLLKSMGKKVSLSTESLYSNLISSFEIQFNENHEQYSHYKNQMDFLL